MTSLDSQGLSAYSGDAGGIMVLIRAFAVERVTRIELA
jgi:hypothetical protein